MITEAPHNDDREILTFEQAMTSLPREARFMATVYAMNTLLQAKGVYTPGEFEACFMEWANKDAKRKLEIREPDQS